MLENKNDGTEQYLTLCLDNVHFALDIASVREILDMTDITSIPHTPDYMCGVVNVRGSAVPVVDLRLKFGMPAAERTLNTRIVILEVNRGERNAAIGAIADSVKEVLEIESSRITPPPRVGTGVTMEVIKGVCRLQEHFLLVLDVAKVFTTDDVVHIDNHELQTEEQHAVVTL